jgi:DHA1 family bicyclomycin/chloramphenicol resistance-like MFS transporter
LTIASFIGLDISAPSLPFIKNYFNTSEKITGLIITIHFFGIFIMSFFYGPISDQIGRRGILLIGLFISVIGGLISTLGNSIEFVIFGRFIQGLGIAAPMILNTAIICEVYDNCDASRFIRMNIGFTTIFTAIAPILGGFINNFISWRGNFAVVLILQIVAFFLFFIFFKETKVFDESHRKEIFFPDIFSKYKNAIFVEKFIKCVVIVTILYGSYLGFINYSAFLYIEKFGLTDIQYSFHQALMIASFSAVNLFFSFVKYDHKFWEKKLIYLGIFLIFTSSFILLFAQSIFVVTILMMIALMGHAIIAPIFFTKGISFVKDKGTASSLIGVFRSISIVFFTGISSYFYNGSILIIGLILFISYLFVIFFAFNLVRKKIFDNN